MKQRIISALIAILILVPLLILGGIYFKIGITILSVFALYEIIKVKDIPKSVSILSCILMVITMLLDIYIIDKIFITIFSLLIILLFFNKDKYNIELATFLISFILIISIVFLAIYDIRRQDINILIYLLLIAILTDTFAYFIGKAFGKHKIIKKVSPNKTVEGTVGGILVGTLISTIYYIYMVNPSASGIMAILITLVLSICGQIGDWVFSSIKRYYNIKDFSNIMPGHGGVLDRFDSTIIIVITYIILNNLI